MNKNKRCLVIRMVLLLGGSVTYFIFPDKHWIRLDVTIIVLLDIIIEKISSKDYDEHPIVPFY